MLSCSATGGKPSQSFLGAGDVIGATAFIAAGSSTHYKRGSTVHGIHQGLIKAQVVRTSCLPAPHGAPGE